MSARSAKYTPNARRVSVVANAVRKTGKLAVTVRNQITLELKAAKGTPVEDVKKKFNAAVRKSLKIRDTKDVRYFSTANTLTQAWNEVLGTKEEKEDGARSTSDWMRAATALAKLSPANFDRAVAKAKALRAE